MIFHHFIFFVNRIGMFVIVTGFLPGETNGLAVEIRIDDKRQNRDCIVERFSIL
jgi:hypothetical protein